MYYIGVDIGGTNLKAGLVDDYGNIVCKESVKISSVGNMEELVDAIAAMTNSLIDKSGVGQENVLSIGIGVPGTVEIHSGTILYTCNLPLRNVPIRKLLRPILKRPVYIENDANCAALAEYYCGSGKGTKRFMAITIGTGIGGGLVHNGKIYHGANGMAGEVGHMSIDFNGLPCPCGRKGCWEQYASAVALKRMTEEEILRSPESALNRIVAEDNGHISGKTPFFAARLGDEAGQRVCDAYVKNLAVGIVNVINLFQPDALAIGGGVSAEREEQLLDPIRRIAERDSIPCNKKYRTKIVTAELGNQAGIIGAAFLGKKRRVI